MTIWKTVLLLCSCSFLFGCSMNSQRLRQERVPALSAKFQGARTDAIQCVGREMLTIPSFGLTNFKVITDLLGVHVNGVDDTFVFIDFDQTGAVSNAKVYVYPEISFLGWRDQLVAHSRQSLLRCGGVF